MMRTLRHVLIANRGEIAARIARTCRSMGITTTAVFSDADADSPHVRAADHAVRIGAAPSSASYLRIDRLLEAAKQTGADAVHPGFGFLAENADFAQAVLDAGLIFVGPDPQTIRDLGSKAAARRLAEQANVPTVPGLQDDPGDDDAFVAAARALPFPLLIKASAGGGGKGMQIVRDAADLADAVASARRLARSAFGDDRLIAERYVERPRHIEVQILGDHHGNVVHLFERECSIQRRYQKIVEESPSPALDADARDAICSAAVRLASSIGYRNAGTVEFLLAPDGAFYFLEVNTRLQVEHPVTEAITGIDIVREQLRVARGEALGYTQADLRTTGHAIEVRLYAEVPHRDFAPATGHIDHLRFPPVDGLRVDSGIESGSDVTPHYDPMLAKMIAHASTRTDAAQRLARALRTLELAGVRTNRDLLADTLEHPAFLSGDTHTHFLTDHADLLAPPRAADAERAVTLAILAGRALARPAPLSEGLLGFRNNPGPALPRRFRYEGHEVHAGWRWSSTRPDQLTISVFAPATEGPLPSVVTNTHAFTLIAREPSAFTVEDERGVRTRVTFHAQRDAHGSTSWWVGTADWNGVVDEPTPFLPPGAAVPAGGCVAPMPGRITMIHVAEGDVVEAGQRLLTLEAMKMEQSVTAPTGGTVRTLHVAVGDQVEADAILALIEDPG